MSANPTWYDLLDVDRTASTDQIRGAWKNAIDGLDPTDRRFRTLSDAASVLLDPDTRREYDAGLPALDGPVAVRVPDADDVRALATAAAAKPKAAAKSAAASKPRAASKSTAAPKPKVASKSTAAAKPKAASKPKAEPATTSKRRLFTRAPRPERIDPAASEPERVDDSAGTERASVITTAAPRLPLVSGRWLAVLGVLAALTGTAAAISVSRSGGGDIVTVANANDSVNGADGNQPLHHDYVTDVEPEGAAALQAAKTAVVPILSYDYRHMDASQQRAEGYMTDAYRQKYDQLFALLKQNAPNTDTIVRTNPPIDAGLTLVSPDRVQVLVFVDRPTTNKLHTKPIEYQDYVTLTMANVDGDWLVDDMETTPAS